MMVVRKLVAAGFALLVASSVPVVQAQVTSNATCAPQYSWMYNSKGQTPCMASAYLSAPCNDGQWNVPGIGPDGPYNHPNGEGANICQCNTVVYNLLSACSICQGGNAGNWANWVSNCTAGNITIGHYPLPLPPGAAIPSWAYLDFTAQDMFQVAVAQQYATSSPPPESMSSPGQSQPLTSSIPSTTAGTSAGTGSVSNPASTSSATAAPSSGGSSNAGKPSALFYLSPCLHQVGRIVGGVVGGILGLVVLLALLGWLFVKVIQAFGGAM